MKHEWTLKRNCSISPRQAMNAYGALAGLTLGVGLAFTLHGFWFVLVFCLLEIAGITVALLHFARHVCDREHIALSTECLLIECIDAGQLHQVRLDPYWTRIALPDHRRGLIRLESRGVRIDIGRLVPQCQRTRVAQELRAALRTLGSGFLS
jgi:uncharacterized membrane protein